MLKYILSHPLTRGLDLDNPHTTVLRRKIIKEKKFLHSIYMEWYKRLLAVVPTEDACPGKILELGSGGGFLKELFPECICSDVFYCPGNDLVLDARQLPFHASSLRAICMVNVFHHIPDVSAFLGEAERVLAPGGALVMWEPWNTPWSSFVYRRLHAEPFDPHAPEWNFSANGPLSGANGALPWIVFERDKAKLRHDFPLLRLESLRVDFPFSYLASGGVSLRALLPGVFYKPFRRMEISLGRWLRYCAMFALIVIRKIPEANQ